MSRFRVGYGIFSAGSLTREGQLLDYHYRDAQASRAALEMSRVKFVGIDHSKFAADAMMPFADISEVDGIFSNASPDAETIDAIKAGGAELYLPCSLSWRAYIYKSDIKLTYNVKNLHLSYSSYW